MTDYLPPVVAKLDGDHAGLVRALREGKDKVQAWAVEVGKTSVTLSVEAKLKDGTLAALRTKVKDSPAAKLAVELQLKAGTLASLRGDVKDAAAAKLGVSAALQDGTLAALRQEIKDAPAATLDTALRLVDDTLAAIHEKVKDGAAARLAVELHLKTGTLTALRGDVKDATAAKLDVAATLKTGTLTALRQEIKDAAAAKLDTDLRLKTGTLAAVRQKVADSPAARLKVKLDLDTVQADLVRTGVEGREVTLKVKPKMDAVAQRRVEAVLRELGKRIDVQIRPVIDQATQVRAEQRLARLSRDRTVLIRTRTVGGGTPSGSGGSGGGMLAAVLPFAPALAPISAAAVNVVASVGAATAAVGVFGLAAISQVKSLGAAATAQQKYNAAVAKYGPLSKQAAAAQQGVSTALEGMPAATQRAAMGYLHLKDSFKSWSDGLAKFTMAPVNHSFVVAEGILPKLSPMVRGVSGELDRLMTVAAGGVHTPGFDSMMTKFTAFADGALKHGVDDVIHFSRVLSEGGGKGAVASFMQYAHDQGPAVREVLKNIAKAVSTVAQGSAAAGPGMLTVVNAAAKLVASLPPEFVGRAMQLYAALKLYKLASSGITSVSGAVQNLSGRLTVLRAASTNAGGGIAGVRAAIGSLSTGAKIGGALAVVAGVVLILNKLSESSKKAPDVNRMTTAIGQLGATGKASGELTRVFGANMDGLGTAIQRVTGKASGMDKFNDVMNKVFTLGMGQSNSMKDSKKQIDAIDKGLASLVSSGHADQAAAALVAFKKAGHDLPKGKLDDYASALADAAFEAKIAAQSQGAFGTQAQIVQKQLDKQKRAAQGLQQAILDLNDANRAALDAESNYAQSVADATAGIKKHEHSLKMSNGQLNLQSQAARDSYGKLSTLAANTEAWSVATLQQTGSQDKANRVLIEGHAQLVKFGDRMGLSTKDAKRFADSLDNIKDPKIQVTVQTMRAEANLAATQRKVNAFPKSTRTTANFAYQRALSDLRFYQRMIDQLHGNTVTVKINGVLTGVNAGTYYQAGPHKGAATGAMFSSHVRRMAEGGMGRPAMMARGGSNVLWAEGGDESYIPHDRRPRSKSIAERTVGIMGGSVSWGGSGGGSPAASTAPLGAQVAKGLWAGMDGQAGWLAAQAKAFALKTIPEPIADALGIHSPSRVAMSLMRWVGAGMVQGLTGSTASVKAATLRLSRSIVQVFHDDAARQLAADKKQLANLAGVKGKSAARHRADLRSDIRQQQHTLGKDSAISRFVAVDNARLLRLAGQRDAVAGKLKAAQSKLASLGQAWAAEKSSISASIMSGASIITASPDAARSVNSFDVVKQMQDQVAKAQQFADELAQLKKKGLRSDLIEQLASAGADQAGATAQALAGGTAGQIAEMNRLQKGLKATADTTGSTVADAMYGAGIKSAQGLVKGLQSQEKAIDAQMLRIAKSMQKAIRQALGIKSPSTVMAVDGEFTGRGFALGLDRSAKHVRIAAQGLAMSARQGATITGGGYRGGGGGGVVNNYYKVELTVEGNVTSERKLLDSFEAALIRRAKNNPSGGFQPTNPFNGIRR